MIFLTVGTQLPFDRLVKSVDEWAAYYKNIEVVAQIGDSSLRPQNLNCKHYMKPNEFKECFEAADVIVAHAGMGTILTGLELGKPVVVVPRLAAHGEHRNDHQLATVKHLSRFSLVRVVDDLTKLGGVLEQVQGLKSDVRAGCSASAGLIESIRTFITVDPSAAWLRTQ